MLSVRNPVLTQNSVDENVIEGACISLKITILLKNSCQQSRKCSLSHCLVQHSAINHYVNTEKSVSLVVRVVGLPRFGGSNCITYENLDDLVSGFFSGTVSAVVKGGKSATFCIG